MHAAGPAGVVVMSIAGGPGTGTWPEDWPTPPDPDEFPIVGCQKVDGAWRQMIRVPSRDDLPLVEQVLAGTYFVEDVRTGEILADTRP